MNNFGTYKFNDSLIHRLSPVDKVISLIFLLIISFLVDQWWLLMAYLFLTVGLAKIAQINITKFIKGIRLFIYIMLITTILQLLVSHSGNLYVELGILRITSGGLTTAFFTFFRFLIDITIINLFLVTTSALEISDATYYLLRPLKWIKVPVNDISLTISLALRFIPTMILEFNNIKDSQRSRGNSFEVGSLKNRIQSFIPLLTPLFINTFRRAENLASAMIVRGYTDGSNVTKLRGMKWHRIDTINLGIISFIMVLFIIIKIY